MVLPRSLNIMHNCGDIKDMTVVATNRSVLAVADVSEDGKQRGQRQPLKVMVTFAGWKQRWTACGSLC